MAPRAQDSFGVLTDPQPDNTSMPAFMVSTTRGFLPRMDPIVDLPHEFAEVEQLLTAMPVRRQDGKPGMLARGELGDAIKALPDLTHVVDKHKSNLPLMNALYRDYSFLASAYLLEPCHLRFMKGEPYGLARHVLPKQLARPIALVADILGFMPFMEYAGSYALFNYRLVDPSLGLEYSNLRLIRAFELGLDPTSDEAGFVLVHVDMVKNSGPLVAGTVEALNALGDASLSVLQQRHAFNAGLGKVVGALRRINQTMETMWNKSRPRGYTQFRTFIFGITSQSMFPDGVVYEGVGDGKPVAFRGESGANDSMVPLMDNLMQVQMPETPLTEILKDFRKYRPSNHKDFLAWVQKRAQDLGVREFALARREKRPSGELAEAIKESRRLWLQIMDQVRDFRWRHWCFAREYILKQTSHPTATGGSPIVTWLPNQLQAVMQNMTNEYEAVEGAKGSMSLGTEVNDMMDLVYRQRETLRKEVEKYCHERGVKA